MPEEKKEKKAAKAQADVKLFTIPLRKAFKRQEGKARAAYAIRLVEELIRRSIKCSDVKIGSRLNNEVWNKKNPPRRVRVNIEMDGTTAKAELMGFKYEEFKAVKFEKKGKKEKLLERLGAKALQKQKEEEMVEGKAEKMEKAENVVAAKMDKD